MAGAPISRTARVTPTPDSTAKLTEVTAFGESSDVADGSSDAQAPAPRKSDAVLLQLPLLLQLRFTQSIMGSAHDSTLKILTRGIGGVTAVLFAVHGLSFAPGMIPALKLEGDATVLLSAVWPIIMVQWVFIAEHTYGLLGTDGLMAKMGVGSVRVSQKRAKSVARTGLFHTVNMVVFTVSTPHCLVIGCRSA